MNYPLADHIIANQHILYTNHLSKCLTNGIVNIHLSISIILESNFKLNESNIPFSQLKINNTAWVKASMPSTGYSSYTSCFQMLPLCIWSVYCLMVVTF